MKKTAKTQWGDKEQRRQDILQAARLQLENEGYQGLNIRQVATRAGVSPGLVYAYFASKEELFATLYAERLQQFQQQVAAIDHSQVHSFEGFFSLLLKAYLPVYQQFGREYNLYSLLRQPQQFPAELVSTLSSTAVALMQQLYQQAKQFLDDADIPMAALPEQSLILPMFWISLNGLADHFSGDRQQLYGHSLENMAQFMSHTLLLGLKQHIQLSTAAPAQEPSHD